MNCQLKGFGGAERDRTADLLVANEALSQLSYSPTGDSLILPANPTSEKHGNPAVPTVIACRIPIRIRGDWRSKSPLT